VAALAGLRNRSTSLGSSRHRLAAVPDGAGAARGIGGRHGASATALIALIALLTALSACGPRPHHADWVIHSAIKVVGPRPPGGFRLVFPYIVGDFYGSPTTGDFVTPVSQAPGSFTLDLNRSQRALESELGPADFSLRFLKVSPGDARLARLTPVALQRNGIEAVGSVEWLDAQFRRPLMLVYLDRPARIAGSLTRGGITIRYDIRVAKPGYVWVGAIETGERSTLYTAVPPPRQLVLTITTSRSQAR
jgi:hypothetical protein